MFILVLLPFGIFSEVLRYFYAKANDTLNRACDPATCLKLLDRLKRIDILHQFRIMGAYLRGFALVDLDRSPEVPKMLETQLGTGLTAKRKLDFEYNYLLFLVACAEDDFKELTLHYAQIQKIFQMSRRRDAGILSLESMILGIYLYQSHKYSEAQTAFDAVDASLLTPREQAYYEYFYALSLYARKKTDAAQEHFLKACSLGPLLPHITASRPDAGNTKNAKM